MGTISSAFAMMSSSLDADQAALNVVANNVANANTTGYTVETPNWRENQPISINGIESGDGASETGSASQRDNVLLQRLDQQQQLASASTSRLSALNTVQALFTPDSGSASATAGDIGSDITGFFSSFSSLETNPTFADLESRMDRQSPVVGFAPGSEISEWIGSSIPPVISSHLGLNSLFSGIQNFGYSVKLDDKAHVGLNLICSSEQAGTLIKDALSAASGLERAAAAAAGPSSLPFNNMAVQSSGRLVAVSLDAPFQ